MFTLDPRLQRDTLFIAKLQLTQILLMNNQDFPWLILVPEVDNLIEWTDLNPEQRHLLTDEITLASGLLKKAFKIDKLNIASLGNIVPQCHIHVIGRRHDDIAWPSPVWGRPNTPYNDPQVVVAQLQTLCSLT